MSVIAVTMTAAAAYAAGPSQAAAPAPGPLDRVNTGQLIPQGTLGGGQSMGYKMNERGDIIGASEDAGGDWTGAVWWHGQRGATDLGVADGFPAAINESGHIIGHIFRDRIGPPFLWRQGAVTYLRSRPGVDLEATALNDLDQIVGTAHYENGVDRAFLWQRGHLTVLPVPAGMRSSAYGINNRGQIMGDAERPGDPTQAVLWQDGRMITLGNEPDVPTDPSAINDLGQVIGHRTLNDDDDAHPFLWYRGTMTDLLAGTTATSGRVAALSDTGMMTGSVNSRAVIWVFGRMIGLRLPGQSAAGSAINDHGAVAGLLWIDPTPPVPFRWRLGHTTVFPEPVANIATTVIGINSLGTIAVTKESTQLGFVLYRSA